MEHFDDVQDLDQYLPPSGMPHLLGHHNMHHGPEGGHYSACYLSGPVSSAPTGWVTSPSYRMAPTSSNSPCLPPYSLGHSSAHVTSPSTHTMHAPYDLSDHVPPPPPPSSGRSPSGGMTSSTTSISRTGSAPQTSPQNLVTTENFLNPNVTDCKYRATSEDPCSVKMEQQQHHQQQPHHAQQAPPPPQPQPQQQQQQISSSLPPPSSSQQGQYQCDTNKFDSTSYPGGQLPPRYGLDHSASYPPMPGPYIPASVSPSPSPSSTSAYQYGSTMGLHSRQGMYPIPAAVPSEQGWERFG